MARLFAIIQLCLAFTLISWNAGYPFLGELYHLKVQRALYHHAVSRTLDIEEEEQAARADAVLTHNEGRSAIEKAHEAFLLLFRGLSPLGEVWLLLAVVVPIYGLLRRAGASEAAWLLPFAAAAYSADNLMHAPIDKERSLFPTEEQLTATYLEVPLSGSLEQQHKLLLKAWHSYLVTIWSPATTVNLSFEERATAGEKRFCLARLCAQQMEEKRERRHTPLVLVLFVAWNIAFAWGMRSERFHYQVNPNTN